MFSCSFVLLSLLVSASLELPSGTETSEAALASGTSTVDSDTAAKSAGKLYFGSATDNADLPDAAYVQTLSNNKLFGQITPTNALKWDATEPSRGSFSFTNADQVVNLAKANGQLIRGHNCVWHNQLPSWVSSGNFDNATLTSILQTHCSTVVGKYKGQIYSWDVVNEPFEEDGTFRSFVFTNTIGTSYIDIALEAARSTDPSTKLYINDFNIEGINSKSTAMLNLVEDLKSRGIPIDGVGIQAHLIVGEIPGDFQANIQRFADAGVEVAITELDIRMTLPVTDALLAQQKTDYQNVIAACKAVSKCVGVTIWDYTDKYSWIPGVFSGEGAALPWDENLVKKPAYDGIIAGFQA